MKSKNIYFFIGTTAELIKIAPVIKEFKKRGIKFKIITSGQVKVNFEDLSGYIGNIKADTALEEKVKRSSLFHFILWAVKTFILSLFTFRKEFRGLDKNTSYFIVHGDTVSALIGAFIAKIYNLKLAHIESGLYSHNLLEPFPEEICRRIIDHIADVLFLSNEWAKNNVKNTNGEKIMTEENTLIESYHWAMKVKPISEFIKNNKKIVKYYILILHRQEHVIFRKKWSTEILGFVIKNANKNFNCILLKHPLTLQIIESLKPTLGSAKIKKLIEIPRLPYPDFMKLMKNAEFIATDGCINQLEAYYMGIPCLALRDRTEQPEGVNKNVVICKSDQKVMEKFFINYKKYKTKPVFLKVSPSKIIVDYLISH